MRPVGERHGAERRESEPGRDQAERLAEVAGLGEDGAIRAGVRVPPLHAIEDGRHEEDRSSALIPMLPRNVLGHLPCPSPADPCQPVSIGLIVI